MKVTCTDCERLAHKLAKTEEVLADVRKALEAALAAANDDGWQTHDEHHAAPANDRLEKAARWLLVHADDAGIAPEAREEVRAALIVPAAPATLPEEPMMRLLRACDEAMSYAEKHYLTSSMAAEMRAFCNGYEGSPNLDEFLYPAERKKGER